MNGQDYSKMVIVASFTAEERCISSMSQGEVLDEGQIIAGSKYRVRKCENNPTCTSLQRKKFKMTLSGHSNKFDKLRKTQNEAVSDTFKARKPKYIRSGWDWEIS